MAHAITSTFASTAVLLLVLTGCPGKVAPESSSPTEACKGYYDAFTGYSERCEVFPDRIGPARARLEEACVRTATAPGATNWAAHLDRCTRELSAAGCNDGGIACFWENVRGELAAGAPCGDGVQCESGHCRRSRDATCGVCSSVEERSPVGGPCESVGCVDGSVCVVSSEGTKCTAIKVADAEQPCGIGPDTITGCAKGLRCIGHGEGRLGTCRTPFGVGADCRAKGECDEGLECIDDRCSVRLPEGATCNQDYRFVCAKGLACDDGTCKKILWVKAGEACDQTTRRCERGDCLADSRTPHDDDGTPNARCVDQPREGDACDGRRTCETPSHCIGGKCTVIDPAACK